MATDYEVVRDILDNEVTFYLDKNNRANLFAEFIGDKGEWCLQKVSGDDFVAFIGCRYREETNERIIPNIDTELEITRQELIRSGVNNIKLHNRLAGSITSGKIAYFHANKMLTTTVITADGFKEYKRTKIKFIKKSNDKAQASPVSGGDLITLLKRHFNLKDEDMKLLAIHLVQLFSRKTSHFVAIFCASMGSGKTTATKMLKSLVEPSEADVSVQLGNISDIVTMLSNNYLVCWDNTEQLSLQISNLVCSATTGSKEVKRKLYSDADQVILDLHNAFILNGLDIISRKSDLAQRCLLFELQPISKSKRKPDSKLWDDFNKDKPAIMGAIFETLSKAMRIMETMEEPAELHRMADAAREMTAISLALNMKPGEFQQLLDANVAKLQETYAEDNPFVALVVDYIRRHGNVEEQAKIFYTKLQASIVGRIKGFPGDPSALSKRLNEESESLFNEGIRFSKTRKNGLSIIRLEKIPQNQLTKKQKERIMPPSK